MSLPDIVEKFQEKRNEKVKGLECNICKIAHIIKDYGFEPRSLPAFDAICISFGWKSWECIRKSFCEERSFIKDAILGEGIYDEGHANNIANSPSAKNIPQWIVRSFAVFGKHASDHVKMPVSTVGVAAFVGMASIAAALNERNAGELVGRILEEKRYFLQEGQVHSGIGGNVSPSRMQYMRTENIDDSEEKVLRSTFKEKWESMKEYPLFLLAILSKAWHLSANEENWRVITGYTWQQAAGKRKPSYSPVSEGMVKVFGRKKRTNTIPSPDPGYRSLKEFVTKVNNYLGRSIFNLQEMEGFNGKCMIYNSLAAMLQDALLSLQEGGLLDGDDIDFLERGMKQLGDAFPCEKCNTQRECTHQHDEYSGKTLRRIEEVEEQNFWGKTYSDAVRCLLQDIQDKSARQGLAMILLAGVPPYEGSRSSTTPVRNKMRSLLKCILPPSGYPNEMARFMRAFNAVFYMPSVMVKVRDERIRYSMAMRRNPEAEGENV